VDFGAFPGTDYVIVAVTGQTGIEITARIFVQVVAIDTADHSIDEVVIDSPEVFAGNIVFDTGFSIYARAKNRTYGEYIVNWAWQN
jgi:hypothetical protein